MSIIEKAFHYEESKINVVKCNDDIWFNPISTGGGGGVFHPMPSKWLRTPQRNKLAP